MLKHFQNPEKQEMVIKNHGEAKLKNMLDHLDDPDKIMLTNMNLIPNFLSEAYDHFMVEELIEM